MTASVSFEKHHRDFLRDPKRAQAYLEVALEDYAEDRNRSALMLALRDIANAQGGPGRLARKTRMNRSHVYKILSGVANPRLVTIEKILRGLGYRLSVEPLMPQKRKI